MSDLLVVSTGLRSPNRKRCERSVATQRTSDVVHHLYVDAADHPERNALENRWRVISDLDPHAIVVELDGDDWLAHDDVLEKIARLYDDPSTWLTYGSFVHADGRPGFCGPYGEGESYRRAQWRASHLKTFRAGLFQRILREDLAGPRGGFCEHARDLVTMLPMLEMAGPDHTVYCPEILYVYDLGQSFEWNASADGLAYERECVSWARSRAEYKRLEAM